MKKVIKNRLLIYTFITILMIQFFPPLYGFENVNATSQVTNGNLLKNPSFEEGVEFEEHSGDDKVGNWFYFNNTVKKVKQDAYSGEWATELSGTNDALEQDVSNMVKGATYKVSVWAKNTDPDKTTAFIVLKNYGGNEKQFKIDSTEYKKYETEFVYTGDQNTRVATWVESGNGGEIYVDDWELRVVSDIEKLSVEDQEIIVDYNEDYQGDLTKGDYEISYTSSLSPNEVHELSILSESTSNNQLIMVFAPIKKEPVEQVITFHINYKPSNQQLTVDYVLDSSGEPVVEAEIQSIVGKNGEVTVTLDNIPTVLPTDKDFTLEYKIDDGTFKEVDITDVKYMTDNNDIILSYSPISQTSEQQTVTVKVTYNDDSVTSSFDLTLDDGVVYYVDASSGEDDNNGKDPDNAWSTIDKVNEVIFQPGDQILFKAGESWTGALKPQGSGVEGAPIVIGSYGEGSKPVLKPGENWQISHMNIAKQIVWNPTVNNGITFHNQEYWEVRDLELYDPSYNENVTTGVYRRGINISAEDAGDLHHFKFDNLEIHGFRGPNSNEGKSSGGVIMTVSTNVSDPSKRVPTAVHDISITNSKLYNLGRSGINFISPWTTREGDEWRKYGQFGYDGLGTWKPYENIEVSNNIIHDIDGDGAIIDGSKNVLVDHNIVYRTVMNSWFAVGLFNWNSDDTVFEFNEVYDSSPSDAILSAGDGQGIEIDALNRNTLVQYNYIHNNSGGSMMWCNTRTLLGFDGIYRYNIFENDGTGHGVIDWREGHTGSMAYNNTFFHGDSGEEEKFMQNGENGMSDAKIFNNIFVNRGEMGGLDFLESEIDWERNIFTGYDKVPENDSTVITDDPLFVAENTGGIGWDTVTGYQLEPDSPAIDAGLDTDDNGGRDYFGTPLIKGQIDIGAVAYVEIINKDALFSAIETAESKDESNYTAESWSALESALTEAKAVNTDENATQSAVNTATTALEAALLGLEEKPVVDRTGLTSAIETAESKNESKYTATSWSALESALTEAKSVNADENATQSAVNTATTTLEAALLGLEEKPVVDKTALTSAIETAESKDESNYTAGSWSALESALTEAESVNADENATQSAVDTATETLESALLGLEERPVVDKNALTSAIETAESKDESNYTAESWSALESALTEAKHVNTDENATQSAVNTATTTLEAALLGLEENPVVDKIVLSEVIESAKQKKQAEYTSDSWDTFEKAFEEATAVLNNESATQEEIDSNIKNLEEAIANLVATTVDDSHESKDPKDPEKPGDPKDSKDPGNTKKPTDQDDNQSTKRPVSKGDNELPSTASNMYNLLFGGLLLVLIGAIFYLQKRKQSKGI